MAFFCVVLHDFLDHLDGIVAKVHKITYPNQDDPLLGGFLDAFCDKIVNIISIWTIIQFINFDLVSNHEAFICLAICYAIISYESIIGIVRIQDFFLAKFKRDFKLDDCERKITNEKDLKSVTAASMEGKLKEKLESTGIAFLCLSIKRTRLNPINNICMYFICFYFMIIKKFIKNLFILF
jgi:phosphatidylglycerophosphate synthase